MGWVRIDDGFDEDDKILRASGNAIALFVCALASVNRRLSDGLVPDVVARQLSRSRRKQEAIDELVTLGLWAKVDGGYTIVNFHKYQRSAAEIRAQRERDKERQQRRRDGAGRNEQGQFEALSRRDNARTQETCHTVPNPNPNQEIDTTYLSLPSEEKEPQNVVVLHGNGLRDAVLAACRIDGDAVPPSVERSYARVVRELEQMHVQPAEVYAKAAAYRFAFPRAALTPTALLKHWAAVEGIATQPKVSKTDLELEAWVRAGE
ncbi:MAG: hypothetical protein E6R03_16725 [Hyphomicrobiaceae bacterium]|nr:MAG: hypothetical protein E6R03_16725 [Hyphomicrobiaceae bacterium]